MTRLPASPSLTERENDVLQLMETWLSWAEVGEKLNVTVNTVKTHVRAIYWKLGVSTRREAVACAHRRGMLG